MAGAMEAAKPIEIRESNVAEREDVKAHPGEGMPSDQAFKGIFGGNVTEGLEVDPNVAAFDSAYNDTEPAPLGSLDAMPKGSIRYFADFPKLVEQVLTDISDLSSEDVYDAVEKGALLLQKSLPNLGSFGRLVEAGIDVFADMQIPNSTWLFRPGGPRIFTLGQVNKIGGDYVTSKVMSPKHVKISDTGSGLELENVAGTSSSPVWIGEKVPGTERYEWKRLEPGVPYQPKGGAMVQVAVGTISLNEKGEPKDFKGADHFGVNGTNGNYRIFRME